MAEFASMKIELDEESKQLIQEASNAARKRPGWLEFIVLGTSNILHLAILVWLTIALWDNQKKLDKNYSDMTRLQGRLHRLEQSIVDLGVVK